MAKWSDAPWTPKETDMKEQLIKACRMHAEGDLERAKTNIMVYMNQSVGIGEPQRYRRSYPRRTG